MTPWTAASQAPLSLGFSKQEYWSGLPFPAPGYSASACNSVLASAPSAGQSAYYPKSSPWEFDSREHSFQVGRPPRPSLYKTPEFPRPGSSIFLVRKPSQANWGKRPGSIGLLSPLHKHIPNSGPRPTWEDSAFSHCHWDSLFPKTPYIFACSLEVLTQGLSPLLV